MIKTTVVLCSNCGDEFDRYVKEVNRCTRLGRNMYCSQSCQSKAHTVVKFRDEKCIRCDTEFTSNNYKGKWSIYCSRSCASLSSVTEYRREQARQTGLKNKANLLTVSETMKLREAWKYSEIASELSDQPHEFEYPLDNYIFDLVLFSPRLMVEFDAPNHSLDINQIAIDRDKDLVARCNGFEILRIPVEAAKVIPKSVIFNIKLRTSTIDGNIFGPDSRISAPPPIPETAMLWG